MVDPSSLCMSWVGEISLSMTRIMVVLDRPRCQPVSLYKKVSAIEKEDIKKSIKKIRK